MTDNRRTGRLVAGRRRELGITQAQLADGLHVSPQAVSKWETGRSMPDPSVMVDLCDALGITVTELLRGERIDMEDQRAEAEGLLVRMRAMEEEANRRLLSLEWVLGGLSVGTFAACVGIGARLGEAGTAPSWVAPALIGWGVAQLLVAGHWSLRIEQLAGYYECGACGHRHVPPFRAVLLAPHMGRTRWMRCPSCGAMTWQRKALLPGDGEGDAGA